MDLWDNNITSIMHAGIAVVSANTGSSGSYFVDEFIIRDDDQEIGTGLSEGGEGGGADYQATAYMICLKGME